MFQGQTTANSGATFGQNDVLTADLELEAKTTDSKQFIFRLSDFEKAERKCDPRKIAVMVVELRPVKRSFVICDAEEFQRLIANQKTPEPGT